MIDIDFDHLDWRNLDDYEQIELCRVVLAEYEDAVRPWKDILLAEQHNNPIAITAIHNIHDWNRAKNNLQSASEPNILGEDKSVLRWQIMYKLHQISAFLEFARIKVDELQIRLDDCNQPDRWR
jgi:hypothetical protein